ncbi:hypothetical protein [Aliagarivorans taiwanensis]|uniref:hypothetical protein n=1 Tax=Aliagarivorans taiwanensis TaxID=561966 RepID=UPI00041612EE|nr:hypothetical protein [Aliagarivorans taiwanensis]
MSLFIVVIASLIGIYHSLKALVVLLNHSPNKMDSLLLSAFGNLGILVCLTQLGAQPALALVALIVSLVTAGLHYYQARTQVSLA